MVSPGFGAGWSTWGDEKFQEAKLFDPDIARALEEGADLARLEEIAREKYPGEYLGGLRDVEIEWIDQGDSFRITEYDGSERLEEIHTDLFRA